jgi:hypothetical protein
MATSRTTTKQAKTKRPAKVARKALSYDELKKLAPKMKPPQTWYDEGTNPFEPNRGDNPQS